MNLNDLHPNENIETSNLNELLPLQIRQNSRTFIEFIEDYYRFLNQQENPSYVIQRIIDEHNIDKVIDEKYLDRIKFEIAKGIPQSPYMQKAFLLKRIIDYYGIRGSEESVKYFFRVFYNDSEVEIYHPWEQVLIPSSGRWVQDTQMKIVLYKGTGDLLFDKVLNQYDKYGNLIAQARVKSVFETTFLNKKYFVVDLRQDTLIGEFDSTRPVETEDRTCLGHTIRSMNKIRIANGGSGYAVGDQIYLQNKTNNSTFKALVTRVEDNTSAIETIRIIERGQSSSFQYANTIPTDIEENLARVYLSGTLSADDTNVYLNIVTEDQGAIQKVLISEIYDFNEDDDPYVDKPSFSFNTTMPYNIEGVTTSSGILVDKISSHQQNTVHHDFVPYALDAELDYSTDFKSLSNVVIESDSGSNAELEFNFKPLYQTAGFYEKLKGDLSGFTVLQDSIYFQVFSYEVLSSLSFDEWKSEFESLVHPTGLKPFNNVNTFVETDGLPELTETNDVIYPADSFGYVLEEGVDVQDGVTLFTQDYVSEDFFLEDYVGAIEYEVSPSAGTPVASSIEFVEPVVFNDYILGQYNDITNDLIDETMVDGQTYAIRGIYKKVFTVESGVDYVITVPVSSESGLNANDMFGNTFPNGTKVFHWNNEESRYDVITTFSRGAWVNDTIRYNQGDEFIIRIDASGDPSYDISFDGIGNDDGFFVHFLGRDSASDKFERLGFGVILSPDLEDDDPYIVKYYDGYLTDGDEIIAEVEVVDPVRPEINPFDTFGGKHKVQNIEYLRKLDNDDQIVPYTS